MSQRMTLFDTRLTTREIFKIFKEKSLNEKGLETIRDFEDR